jgi:FkbM family methyltransferase
LPPEASTIVDLGANIGLAALYFGTRYPQAKILSVEPDPGPIPFYCVI